MLDERVIKWIRQLIEVGLSLIAIGIVLQILFGKDVAFLPGDIVWNFVAKVALLGDYGLVGLVVGGGIFWLFVHARVWSEESKMTENTITESPNSTAPDKTR